MIDLIQARGTRPRDNWGLSHIGIFNPGASDMTTGDTAALTKVDNFVESIRDNTTTSEKAEKF